MDHDEKNFWENYKKDLIDPVQTLIDDNQYTAAAKLILSGIDSLAAFYTGRTTPGNVKTSFIKFIDDYMPHFNDVNFQGGVLIVRKTNRRINKASEIVYEIFRNDLLHDGSLGIGVGVYRDNNDKILWTGSGVQVFNININGLFGYFKKAINDFEHDISAKQQVHQQFRKKYLDVIDFTFTV